MGAESSTSTDTPAGGERAPIVELTVKVFSWEPGQSEVGITFFDQPADAAALDRLKRRVEAELGEAFEVASGLTS